MSIYRPNTMRTSTLRFTTIFVQSNIYSCRNPRQLWGAHWESLSDDIEAMTRCERADPTVTLFEDVLKDRALYEIDQVLMRNGHRLEDFPMFPESNYIHSVHGGNRLLEKELAYDQHSLTIDADNAEDKFNNDQRNAYETILNVVTNKEGKLFFVYGPSDDILHFAH